MKVVANTSSRTLRLLSLLQTHRHWSGTDLAERLEVSPRTVRRDVDRLRELGYPVDATPGLDGGYTLAPGASLPPLVVDDDEAVALAVGMQAAAAGSVLGMQESSLRALTKVVQVMPPRLRSRVEALRSATVPASWGPSAEPTLDPDALIALAQACRDSVRVRFGYADKAGAASERYVEPNALVPLGRRWYLLAYDLDRQDWRSFRLDRLSAPATTTERFRGRELPAADAGEFLRSRLQESVQGYRVEVLIDAPADAVAARIGRWGTVTAVEADRCRLVMQAESLEWAAFSLGIAGAGFEVVEPAALTALLNEWGGRFTSP